MYSQVITKFPFEFQQKQVLDQALEIFKTYLGKTGDSLPASGEEGDKFLLLDGDNYTAYEYKDGTWQQASISSGSGGGSGGSIDLSNYYTKNEINSKLVSVYKYKGTVASVSNLPTTSTVGYVYNVSDTGMNYAWDGTKWDALGSEIDLSNFVKNTDFATSTKGGVIKFSTSHGVNMSADGFLMGATRTAEQYNSNSGNMLINKGTLENVLNNRGQDWEFTLSDGSTVTKKVVCA